MPLSVVTWIPQSYICQYFPASLWYSRFGLQQIVGSVQEEEEKQKCFSVYEEEEIKDEERDATWIKLGRDEGEDQG